MKKIRHKKFLQTRAFMPLLLVSLTVFSCRKYVDIPPPQDQLVSQSAFADDNTATATVVGIYTDMNSFNYQFTNTLGNFMPAMSADEFYYAFTSFDAFKLNSLLPSNSYVSILWSEPYSYIYHANAVLEGLKNSSGLSSGVKDRLTGEAEFVRAFCHFYLVNYFGDVPLILNTDYKTNTNLPRTPAADVYAAIISDLTDAVNRIPDDYPDGERIRPNKSAANALLARAYLYTGKWAEAEATASLVIDDAQYQLLPDLTQVFLKNSGEAIWQLRTVNTSTYGVNTWEGFNIVPATPTSRAYYNLYDQLVNAFEPGDQRKAQWTGTYTTSGTTYHFLYKYKTRTSSPVSEYSMVFRLAEQYLIRAEARIQQDKLDEGRDDLDALRSRAGLADLPTAMSKDDLLLAVEQERRVELFGEWGHRWFDLKRTNRADAVLGAEKPTWTPTAVLYPIPSTAILTNLNLKQNPGYN
ncbi:MAG TPA: RagB/SusD family nutrient uptake outer membrane protein [Puia sp.]|nr:RagB/SusD family nutrient uptake outer membrane protein [Puia sp.]